MIDEYTGKIDTSHALAGTRVLASNDSENTSVYPETQITFSGVPVFRQYSRVPVG